MIETKGLTIDNIEEVCIIDDDSMALFLAEKIFEFELPNTLVKCFDNVDSVLDYLHYNIGVKRLILVDLNMPLRDGWSFLDSYKGNINDDLIFILSSSDNLADKKKAKTYPQVVDYLEKPMTIDLVEALFDKYK